MQETDLKIYDDIGFGFYASRRGEDLSQQGSWQSQFMAAGPGFIQAVLTIEVLSKDGSNKKTQPILCCSANCQVQKNLAFAVAPQKGSVS